MSAIPFERFARYSLYQRMNLATTAFLLLLWHVEVNCNQVWPGKPDDAYRIGHPAKGLNYEECETELFETNPIANHRHQVIAFSVKDAVCILYDIPASVIVWDFNRTLKKDDDEYYNTTVKFDSNKFRIIPKPKLLWLFDKVKKGSNLGDAGKLLDLPMDEMNSWIAVGPKPHSFMTYFNADGTTPYIKKVIPLVHNKKRILSVNSQFTISTWVRLNADTGDPFFSTTSNTGIYSWFTTGGSLDWHPTTNAKISKPTNSLKFNVWQHIAITHCGKTALPTFFLNGDIWKLSKTKSYDEMLDPPDIMMRFGGLSGGFKGSMACFAIFEMALSQDKIKTLMQNCP